VVALAPEVMAVEVAVVAAMEAGEIVTASKKNALISGAACATAETRAVTPTGPMGAAVEVAAAVVGVAIRIGGALAPPTAARHAGPLSFATAEAPPAATPRAATAARQRVTATADPTAAPRLRGTAAAAVTAAGTAAATERAFELWRPPRLLKPVRLERGRWFRQSATALSFRPPASHNRSTKACPPAHLPAQPLACPLN